VKGKTLIYISASRGGSASNWKAFGDDPAMQKVRERRGERESGGQSLIPVHVLTASPHRDVLSARPKLAGFL